MRLLCQSNDAQMVGLGQKAFACWQAATVRAGARASQGATAAGRSVAGLAV